MVGAQTRSTPLPPAPWGTASLCSPTLHGAPPRPSCAPSKPSRACCSSSPACSPMPPRPTSRPSTCVRRRSTPSAGYPLFAGTEWELVAILPALASAAHVSLATTRLLQMFDEPFPVLGHEYRLLPAVGAAVFPEAGRQPEALLQAARLALHEAQRSTPRQEVYRTEMEQSAARHAAIEHGFLEALREGQLELYLQPQVDARSGRCLHAEALLRWPRTGAGNVAPSCIVDIAEDAGVGPEFSRWLITRAARTLAEFADARIPLHLSINLTANDLRDHELPDVIEHALALWKVPAERLTLELTESAMIADEQCSLGIMRRLRGLGCHLALDRSEEHTSE